METIFLLGRRKVRMWADFLKALLLRLRKDVWHIGELWKMMETFGVMLRAVIINRTRREKSRTRVQLPQETLWLRVLSSTTSQPSQIVLFHFWVFKRLEPIKTRLKVGKAPPSSRYWWIIFRKTGCQAPSGTFRVKRTTSKPVAKWSLHGFSPHPSHQSIRLCFCRWLVTRCFAYTNEPADCFVDILEAR